MSVYGYCRCGERVERNEYREHVLTCPSHEEDRDAPDTVDEGAGTSWAGPVELVEADQVRAYIVSRYALWEVPEDDCCPCPCHRLGHSCGCCP